MRGVRKLLAAYPNNLNCEQASEAMKLAKAEVACLLRIWSAVRKLERMALDPANPEAARLKPYLNET